jgi:hypothetical protein
MSDFYAACNFYKKAGSKRVDLIQNILYHSRGK